MSALRAAAYALRVVLELLVLAALVYAGALLGGVGGLLGGIAAAVVVIVVWGRYIAPRAAHPPRTPVRLAIEVAIFVVACAALVAAGRPVLGLILAALYVADRVAIRASGAPTYETAAR